MLLRHGLPVVARAVAGDVARLRRSSTNLQPIPQTLGLLEMLQRASVSAVHVGALKHEFFS